ncbi:MAG: hypothetical protein ACK46X_16565 [Candidatus Sericytochromatia bacterium]
MPVAAIPFKSPPPFELPFYIAEALRELSLPAAIEHVERILMDSGCADAILSVVLDGAGHLRPGPYRAHDPHVETALKGVYDEMCTLQPALDSEPGRQDFMGQAIAAGQPLLMMGDVTEGAADPFPATMRGYLLHGEKTGNVGFMYVFPIKDDSGAVHGAMALHRWLASGPLNHDQPAITHALILELARRAGQLSKQA